jgi:hypothetical protein
MKKAVWLMAAGLTTLAGVARGQTTYVNPDGGFNQDERCLVGVNGVCQGGTYDGAMSIISIIQTDLGGVPLTRVSDGLDRIWEAIGNANNPGRLVGRARYAAHNLELGYDLGAGYVPLVSNIPNGEIRVTQAMFPLFAGETSYPDAIVSMTDPWPWQPVILTPGTLFAFILSDLSTSGPTRWSSNNTNTGVGSTGYANSGSPFEDHMVTFQVSEMHYVIAFEDLPFATGDEDYNDMVLEVKWLAPVPLPAGLPLLLSGLLGLAAFARRNRHA